jgi:drug/metabolite transporter (DMT)-like permease
VSRPARNETLGMALGLVGVAIFSGSLPATRLALASLDPDFLIAARAAIAGLIAVPVLLARSRAPPWRDAPKLFVCALRLVVGFPGFTSLAMRDLPAAHGAVVVGALPLFTALAGALVDGERPSPAFWLLAALGASVIVGFALYRAGGALQLGDAELLLAVACAALGYAWSAQLSRRMPAYEVISWVVVLALPISAPLSLLWRPMDFGAVSPVAWACLAYLGAMSMYLGFFAWNAGLALGGLARVGQVQLLQPFLTLALAATLLGERIDAETAIAATLVAAIVLAGRRLRVGRVRPALARP